MVKTARFLLSLLANCGIAAQSADELRTKCLAALRAADAALESVELFYRCMEDPPLFEGHGITKRICFGGHSAIEFDTSHYTATIDWRDYIKRVVMTFDKGALYTIWPNELLYSRQDLGGLAPPWQFLDDPFLRASGWWPLAAPFGSLVVIGQKTSLREELAEGWAWAMTKEGLLEASSERGRVLMQPQLSYAVVRREFWDTKGRPLVVLCTENHRRIDNGLHVPEEFWQTRANEPGGRERTIRCVLADAGASRSLTGVGLLGKPGMAELKDGKVSQREGGGLWLLEARADELARGRAAKPWQMDGPGWASVVALLLAVAWLWLGRRVRGRKRHAGAGSASLERMGSAVVGARISPQTPSAGDQTEEMLKWRRPQ